MRIKRPAWTNDATEWANRQTVALVERDAVECCVQVLSDICGTLWKHRKFRRRRADCSNTDEARSAGAAKRLCGDC